MDGGRLPSSPAPASSSPLERMTTSSRSSSSASPRSRPPCSTPPSSASAGSASSATKASTAGSAPATATTLPSSASSPSDGTASPSRRFWGLLTASPATASPFCSTTSASAESSALAMFVLLLLPTRLLVWDPSSGDASIIPIPWGFDSRGRSVVFNGAVLRDACDVNGGEHLGHFQVVLVSTNEERTRAFVCVFSLETGGRSNPISVACPSMTPTSTPGTFVGRSLYWALDGDSHGILEFDLDKQCLRVIDVTLFLSSALYYRIWVMPVEGGVLGYLFYSINHGIELWKRIADRDGGAGWVLERSFELDEFLPPSSHDGSHVEIVGIAEDSNVFYLQTKTGVFMVHMESMQCKKVSEMSDINACHSFTSVYTTDFGVYDGEDGDEPLH